jgi:hypothetical protein
MNRLFRNLLGIFVLAAASVSVAHSQSLPSTGGQSKKVSHSLQRKPPLNLLVEEFSFFLKDFKMVHQGDTNNLNISISYRYNAGIVKADYPDFRSLAKDVETLLAHYPNKDDYWEIVNKEITSLLLTKYPAITSVVCDLKVDPSSLVPYTRSSRVTRARATAKRSPQRGT